jgi:hypothetical protein
MSTLEEHRQKWAEIAKKYDWYAEPFFIQVWRDPETHEIYDSVSFSELTEDIQVYEKEE